MKKAASWIAVAAFVGFCAAVALLLPRWWQDPLCHAVGELGYECLPRLEAETAFEAGALRSENGAIGALNGSSCLLPGAELRFPAQRTTLATPLRVSMSALSGANALAHLWPADAQPNYNSSTWAQLQEVAMEAKALAVESISPQTLKEGLESCAVAPACATAILEGKTQVVTSVLKTPLITYRLLDHQGKAIAASTLLSTSAFAGKTLLATQQGLASAQAQVLGVRWADEKFVTDFKPCTSEVAYEANADSWVHVKGGGGAGSFAPNEQNVPLGQTAIVSATGTEKSDCGLTATPSRGYAHAEVLHPTPGTLSITGEARATSGRYHEGRCESRTRRESTGLLTTDAFAEFKISAEISVFVRRNGVQHIDVDWENMPKEALLRVVAPLGDELLSQSIETEGSERIEIQGPGVFRVQTTVARSVQRQGESGPVSAPVDARLHARLFIPE